MAKEFDETIIKAWNAMYEAWQMSNFVSARKIAVSLRPLTMPEWADKWREFDAIVIEAFGGSFPDANEIEEMRAFVSKLTTEKNRLEHENQSLAEEKCELVELEKKARSELAALKREHELLQADLAKAEHRGKAPSEETDAPESADDLLLALNSLRLARKANAHLFRLSKQMQKKLEAYGESVEDFDALDVSGKSQERKRRGGRPKREAQGNF